MKKAITLLLAFAFCLTSFSACTAPTPSVDNNTPPTSKEEQTTPSPSPDETTPAPIHIDHLTFEMVVSWEDSDRLLGEMKNLSNSLRDALQTQNCQVDDVTITISTAAGLTGDALENGGVDLAFIPAADYVSCDKTVGAILTSDETPCTVVLAVSSAKTDLSEAFHHALTQALLETESGNAFLRSYHSDIVFVPATEEAIQAVRDFVDSMNAN